MHQYIPLTPNHSPHIAFGAYKPATKIPQTFQDQKTVALQKLLSRSPTHNDANELNGSSNSINSSFTGKKDYLSIITQAKQLQPTSKPQTNRSPQETPYYNLKKVPANQRTGYTKQGSPTKAPNLNTSFISSKISSNSNQFSLNDSKEQIVLQKNTQRDFFSGEIKNLSSNIYGLSNKQNQQGSNSAQQTKIKTMKDEVKDSKESIKSKDSLKKTIIDKKDIKTEQSIFQPIHTQPEEERDLFYHIIKLRQENQKDGISSNDLSYQGSDRKRKQFICINHPLKVRLTLPCYYLSLQAKFQTNDEKFLCSLCAIEEAYRGNNLIYLKTLQRLAPKQNDDIIKRNEIVWDLETLCFQKQVASEMSSEFLMKKKELQGFLDQLKNAHSSGETKLTELGTLYQRSDVTQFNNEQIDHLCVLISEQFRKFLKAQYKEILTPRSLEQSVFKDNLRSVIVQLESNINDIQCIRNDIIQNIRNILLSMEIEPFQLIIQKYQQKIKVAQFQLQNNFSKLENKFNLINFEILREKLLGNENMRTAYQNFILCALHEDYDSLIQLGSRKSKPVYISFENKDMFKPSNKENQKSFRQEEPLQRQSSKNKFIELLNKINTSQNEKNTFLNSMLTPNSPQDNTVGQRVDPVEIPVESQEHSRETHSKNLLLSPHFNDLESFYQ